MAADQYEDLSKIIFADDSGSDSGSGPLSVRMEQLSVDLKLPQRLRDVGIQEADLPALAREAMQQTRLLPNNPREVLLEDAMRIYEQSW